ncbi:MAG: hypothetical protein AAB250_02670 [Bdellovibrionota bacterium]
MNQLFLNALSILCLVAAASAANAQSEPTKIAATYSHMYAPGGFDSNDQVQIVGEGIFRNTCYRPTEPKVRIDELKHQIFVGPAAYEYSGFCLQVILPFTRVVDVGILKPGKWEIFQGPQADRLGEVTVRAAITDSADDFLYAPISQAFFQQKGTGADVLITGEFSNSCMQLDSVMVTIEPEVLVLQPVAKMDTTAGVCKDGKFPFSKKVSIKILPLGRYLLHVRSMNGNAVNTLVTMN